MKKFSLKNRRGQNIVGVVANPTIKKGLAFVLHGLSGNKEQPHIAAIANAFREKQFVVVRFDSTNTFGESDGNYE